jgi:hypothetical protein
MKHYFTTTTGKKGLHTEEEIDMVHEFESRGLRVDEISTVNMVVTVKWADGTTSEYHKIRFA